MTEITLHDAATHQDPPICKAPSLLQTLHEVRAPLDALALVAKLPKLAAAPRGDGRAVMLVPGYLGDGYSMAPLRGYLGYLGYNTFDWGLGRNRGDVEDDIQRLGEKVVETSESLDGEPLTLVGWSLGGVLCREVARLYAEQTQEVITIGTPIVGGPKYTALKRTFVRRKGIDLPELEKDIHRRNSLGIPQAVTSIYSKSDGIVGWRSSIDVYNPQANNLEVKGSHMTLGVNPRVWLSIAEILAGRHSSE